MASTGGDGVSASRLANLVAPTIVAAFEAYEAEFQALTRRARGRFDRREWRSALEDSTERLDLYGEVIGRLEEEVRAQLDSRVSERLVILLDTLLVSAMLDAIGEPRHRSCLVPR